MLAGDSVSTKTRAWALELLAKGGNGQKGQDMQQAVKQEIL